MVFRAMLDHNRRSATCDPCPACAAPAEKIYAMGAQCRTAYPALPGRLRLRTSRCCSARPRWPGHDVVPSEQPLSHIRLGRHGRSPGSSRDHGPRMGRCFAPGEQGEIVYRGPSTDEPEYLPNDEATHRGVRALLVSPTPGIGPGFGRGLGGSGFADRYKAVIQDRGRDVGSIEVEKPLYATEQSGGPRSVVVGASAAKHWTRRSPRWWWPSPVASIDRGCPAPGAARAAGRYKVPKCDRGDVICPRPPTGKILSCLFSRSHFRSSLSHTTPMIIH